MDNESKNFKGLFIAASFAVAFLSLGAAWSFLKDALIADVTGKLDRVVDQHGRDIADQQLHLACWANASLSPPEEQLTRYIYCKYGKVSKDIVAQ